MLRHHEDEPSWRSHAACADRSLLPLVDAAYERPGGPAGERMRREVCRRCCVSQQCFDEALRSGEWGIWGAATPNQRTRLGGAPCGKHHDH
jgi:hypothetical protein